MRRSLLCAFAACAALSAGSASATVTYSITSITDAGQTNVGVAGINDVGTAVVNYGSGGGGAFTYSYPSGTTTPIIAPLLSGPGNTTTVAASAINSSGSVAGFVLQSQNGQGQIFDWNGFVDTGGVFTYINMPGQEAPSTQVLGMNDSGQVYGDYLLAGGGGAEGYFTEVGGVYTAIGHSGYSNIVVSGIDNAGAIVGTATISGHRFGFIDSGGFYTTLFDSSGTSTTIEAVSKNGIIAGIYFDPTDFHNVGFIYQGGVFTSVAPVGSTNVSVDGVNNSGDLALEVNGTDEAYDAATGAFTVLGPPLSNFGENGSGPDAINDAGLIAGNYSIATNAYDGFIAAPIQSRLPGTPEPATWALMLVGFGGLGGALRMAQRKTSVIA